MVGLPFIGFIGFCFIGMTLINQMICGTFITSADMGSLNNITLFRSLKVFNLFSVSVPNLSFLTDGIPHLVKFDYSFFGGNSGLIQFLLFSITGALAFGLFVLMISLIFSWANRTR